MTEQHNRIKRINNASYLKKKKIIRMYGKVNWSFALVKNACAIEFSLRQNQIKSWDNDSFSSIISSLWLQSNIINFFSNSQPKYK